MNAPVRPEPPLALLAELTHRCPLRCPYCSNPVELARASEELSTEDWKRVLAEAASMGVLQLHFSGGEPLVRQDVDVLVAEAARLGLYTNLITSAVLADEGRMAALAAAGLDHVQISVQDADPANADRIAGLKDAHRRKLEVARRVREAGLALTLNAPVHRQNLDRLEEIIALAVEMGAHRLEVAHVQYYGWALANRAALMPSRDQLERATAIVDAARVRLKGVLAIDYVVPDYYAARPKACMGGWGRQFLVVGPTGLVLPCHAAQSIPNLAFESVRDRSLADIWTDSPAFVAYRGTAWMAEPCRTCDRREIDWGGCRCQAMALAGDAAATDPACGRSPLHAEIVALAAGEAARDQAEFVYRQIGGLKRQG
jgi:pyrroloquinoline quinone biosynthesis protein E